MSEDQRRADEIRLRLVEAAADEFAQSGLDGARVHSIAAKAGLSTGAIYNRFQGRLELLLEALDVSFVSAWDAQSFSQEGFLEAFATAACRLALDEPGRGDALLVETIAAAQRHPDVRSAAGRLWERETKTLTEVIQTAVERGELHPSIDPTAFAFFAMALNVGAKALRQAGVEAPSGEAWTVLIRLMTDGFATDPPAG